MSDAIDAGAREPLGAYRARWVAGDAPRFEEVRR